MSDTSLLVLMPKRISKMRALRRLGLPARPAVSPRNALRYLLCCLIWELHDICDHHTVLYEFTWRMPVTTMCPCCIAERPIRTCLVTSDYEYSATKGDTSTVLKQKYFSDQRLKQRDVTDQETRWSNQINHKFNAKTVRIRKINRKWFECIDQSRRTHCQKLPEILTMANLFALHRWLIFHFLIIIDTLA